MRQLKITRSITNREQASVEKYLQQIGKVDLITADEEVELAKRIKKGDQRALERLVNANLRFVVSVAKQYQNQGLTLNDLINEGNVGLVKAAQKFDETRGFKFISYAVWWIRQSIMAAVSENSRLIRLPLNKVGLINKIKRATIALESEFDREPTNEELASYLNESLESIENTIKTNKGKHISIDASDGDEDELGLLGKLPVETESPDHEIGKVKSQKTEVERFLSKLSPQEQQVLKQYYGIEIDFPMTLEEIGKCFPKPKTAERVRQMKDRAINRLRRFSNKHDSLKNSF